MRALIAAILLTIISIGAYAIGSKQNESWFEQFKTAEAAEAALLEKFPVCKRV